jgi:DUF1680 family protein
MYKIKGYSYEIPYILVVFLLFFGTLHAQEKLYTNEFPLSEVSLLDGPFKHARDLNIKILLKYDVDRLLAGYRKEAGLPAKANIYSNWDGLDGHIGGHYLSALAMNYASTKNLECKKRVLYIISELKACQEANAKNHPDWGKGYIGAVPNGNKIWSTLQKADFTVFKSAWVPWYNVHKMYAGLRDAWAYTGNEDAKLIFLNFCDWGIRITASLTDDQMQSMLDTEQGGMNEVFADAYQITGNEKYLVAAKRFSHRMLLDAMSTENDNLDNKHANTQVPKAIGFERIAELSKDNQYEKASSFFWQTVTSKRTLAFGGNSRREFFPSIASSTDFINDFEGPESCNSYNMLKLTVDLFRVNPEAKYADYYERTLFNHILSTQHPEHGGYVYFTPARPNHYRVYSAPNQAMWCCVGSGMENHGKYNQFIYTHQKDVLYLNLFIASSLNWKEKQVQLKQETNFPYEEQTKITITSGEAYFKLMIRNPYWVKSGALKITVNGKIETQVSSPSTYIAIERFWKKGDVIKISLPMTNSVVALPNVPNYIAFMHGPILMGAKTNSEDLQSLIADDSRWAHIAGGKKIPISTAPILLTENIKYFSEKLKPVPGKPLQFIIPKNFTNNSKDLLLQPFYTIHDSRYMMYWMTLNKTTYQSYLDSIGVKEKMELALQKRTIDFVAPGEQQPEADHFIQKLNSNTGNYLDAFWRDARNGGYFSYQLNTRQETDLSLLVRYWGNEKGNRDFEIYVEDQKIITETIVDIWNDQQFHDVEYPIPNSLITNKDRIRIKFQSLPENIAGAVYYVRLLRTNKGD